LDRPRYGVTTLTYDLDIQSQASYGHDSHRYTKLKFKGQSV